MKNLSQKERTIVALDVPDLEEMEKILFQLQGIISFYKIGFELFTAHGWKAVELVKARGARVFLDLKLHDIPNTAANTAAVICKHNVDIFNVHALGGLEMMQKTYKAVLANSGESNRPIVIAVTILTSHEEKTLDRDMGLSVTGAASAVTGLEPAGDGHPQGVPLPKRVRNLAHLAQEAGLDGVVSSCHEIPGIREACGETFQIITPGIRPAGGEAGDQKRIMTPQEAFAAGSNFIVIGRPITQAPDPGAAAQSILETLD